MLDRPHETTTTLIFSSLDTDVGHGGFELNLGFW